MKKIILAFVVSCFLFSGATGQEIEWQNTIGGSNDDKISSIRQTSDGGYILGGTSGSNISGDKTENNWDTGLSTADYWIVKTDASGNIQWQNTIGGSWYEYLSCIQQTSDGGYILGGTSSSGIGGDKTENCFNLTVDYWIVKVDASGNIQWQNTIGGSQPDFLYSIQQTSDGGYILGGFSESSISGDKTENSMGGFDYWIVKLDASGYIQWQNTIGGNNHDHLYSVQQTSDGGYILGGDSYSDISGDKTENRVGEYDYWIVKIDASGNIQWQNTIGGSGDDWPRSVQQTSDDGYMVCGLSESNISGDKTENSNGFNDSWIVKTDATGNIQWQNTIGGSVNDDFTSFEQTSDGGYIFGGLSNSPVSGDITENNNWVYDYWIVKTDSSGNIQWQNKIGGSNDDVIGSIKQTSDGGYILAGSSYSNLSGDKTENSMGMWDIWIVKLTDTFNSITGKLFIDANSNGMQDAGETGAGNKTIAEINTGRFNFSNQNGEYLVSVLDSGNFSVSPTSINYYNAVPASHQAYFPGIQQTDSLNDFAFQASGVFNDLCITITPMGNFRAGFDVNYMINYENIGTTTLNGTVIFFPDDDVTFVSSNPVATSVTTDSVVWNVGILTPFQTGSILLTVNVNLGTPIGTLIKSGVRIEPVAGDANTACNYNTWEVYTTGSFDPNAILVDRDTILTTELSNPPYLDYVIYFQNTGNDTAFNIKILNPFPQRLKLSSFEFISSSHPVNINYSVHEKAMWFIFDNIHLPDSTINEPASHGYVRYRAKPKTTLTAGNKIENNAAIYFDFNQSVMTNTAVTEIVLPTGINLLSMDNGQLIMYPNPISDILTLKIPSLSTVNCQLSIYDLFRRKVLQSAIQNSKSAIKINVSGFSQGIYFVEVQSGEKVLRGKFLKK